jgi:hypothetical protein
MTEINKYHNSKIYKLVSPQTEKYYIGSTTRELYIRKSQHKYDYKKYLENNNNKYMSSYEILKYNDFKIELIKLFKCENKKELEIEETKLIKEHHNNILNKNIPNRDNKEYYKDNKEKIQNYKKEWHNDNKERLNKKSKEYHIINKEKLNESRKIKLDCLCGGNYLITNKARHLKSTKHLEFIMN